MLVGLIVSSYGAVGLAAALSVGGGHEGRGEEDGGAHSCCGWRCVVGGYGCLVDACMYSDVLRVKLIDVNAIDVM